eukprot:1723737-Rhodomonas_salina.1
MYPHPLAGTIVSALQYQTQYHTQYQIQYQTQHQTEYQTQHQTEYETQSHTQYQTQYTIRVGPQLTDPAELPTGVGPRLLAAA